jgi:Heparinase II/III-like protein/Heparinase II/III N-terminus
MNVWGMRAARLLRKPPGYVIRRVAAEMRRELDRFAQPHRARTFNGARLCRRTGAASVADLWAGLREQPWPVANARIAPAELDRLVAGSTALILERAERALRHEVDLLGSGPTPLGEHIRWDVDFKTGARWEPRYFRDIPTLNAQRPSDIKVPWELSRLQWLIPAGQAFLLTAEERYAAGARAVLEQWIAANPTGQSVNWALAMEPAMRIFSWSWLFRVFGGCASWSDAAFRERFLCSLYQHAQFVALNIERADLNGNHFTADCAALAVAGAFFPGAEANGWARAAHADLEREIAVQILPDGVDFEASSGYHRFVAELFLVAALHLEQRQLAVSARYRERLAAAARFCAAYTRGDGRAPLWGDADDARALPLGTAGVRDHRHLIACTAVFLRDKTLAALATGGWDEALWWFGAHGLAPPQWQPITAACEAFPDGGAYVLRAGDAHVFIDCGPVGLAGRGGHGHNDALSFEATLQGVPVVADAGCYVYTASFDERNRFRSTAAHNTPQVDAEEINRFFSPELLWLLRNDSEPLQARVWREGGRLLFEGSHGGYQRLSPPVTPRRCIELSNDARVLKIIDRFAGSGTHAVSIPLLLAPEWALRELGEHGCACRHADGACLSISWEGAPNWEVRAEAGRVAPSYGVVTEAVRLIARAHGNVEDMTLTTTLQLELGGPVR